MHLFVQAFMRFFFKHLYTTVAWSYDFVAWATSMGQWRTWQQAALTDYPSGKLLEIGHGPGHLLLDFRKAGHEIVGIDVSRQMARMAAERLRNNKLNADVVRADARALPFAADAFSGILATFPSDYILNSATLYSVRRCLRSGGKFVIIGLARITGTSFYDRFAGWLYRITGQADHPDAAFQPWLERLEDLCFVARIEIVTQPRAEVIRLIAEKR